MKALSVQQPWAWLIVTGRKDIENRDWSTKYRGPLLIHAAKTFDEQGRVYVRTFFTDSLPDVYVFGAIIGKTILTDCVTSHPSKWFTGPHGFVLKNPEMFPHPFPCRGRLGLFDVDNNPDQQWYRQQLMSEECLCGRSKAAGYSFCYSCFKQLPANLGKALYQKIGQGYENAFERSHKYLAENVW